MADEVTEKEIEAVDRCLCSMGLQESVFTISIGSSEEFDDFVPDLVVDISEIKNSTPNEWKTKGKYDVR